MGIDLSARALKLITPWAIIVLFISSFIFLSENSFAQVLLTVMVIVVTGYAVMNAFVVAKVTDAWEKAILSVTIGITLSFITFLVGNLNHSFTWVYTTAYVLLPISFSILLIATVQIYYLPKPIGEEVTLVYRLRKEIGLTSLRQKLVAVLAMFCVIIIVMVSLMIFLNNEPDRFTEFYVLNEDGHGYDYPSSLSLGENATIIIGIVNHERRTVNYTVELWLVNYSIENMAVNVTQMFYVESFNVVLENSEYDLNDPWKAQFEVKITFTPKTEGDFRVLILLFKDGAEPIPGPNPPDPLIDYSKTAASWRVVMSVNDEVNYLTLFLDVNP